MKKFAIIFFILLYLTTNTFSMSLFSSAQKGIGLREYITSVRGMGMGGTGLALVNQSELNAYNFSLWRYIQNTRMSALMRYDMNYTIITNENLYSSTGNFAGIQLAIPLIRNRWVFGFSITPYTIVDFGYNLNLSVGTKPYVQGNFFKGNISKVQFSSAWSVNRNIGVAASFDYYIGTILDRYTLDFDSPEFYDSYSDVNYLFKGFGFGLGFDVRLYKSLVLGGFVDFKPTIHLTKTTYSPITFSELRTEKDANFPINCGMGLSYMIWRNWTLSSDVIYQDWSNITNLGAFNSNLLEDWYQWSAGIEHNHIRGRKESVFNKVDTRMGFSIGNIGYKFNGSTVKQYAVHLGLGVPFNKDLARLDFAVIAGIRGDRKFNSVEEKFVRFLFSISAGELWFQRLR